MPFNFEYFIVYCQSKNNNLEEKQNSVNFCNMNFNESYHSRTIFFSRRYRTKKNQIFINMNVNIKHIISITIQKFKLLTNSFTSVHYVILKKKKCYTYSFIHTIKGPARHSLL